MVHLYLKVKSAGKRVPLIIKKPVLLEKVPKTTNQLIDHIVRMNVQEYNLKKVDEAFFPWLTETEISDMSHFGKVGFSNKYRDNIQDVEEAVLNALQCYEDGIYRLFINQEEYIINQDIQLVDNDEITFIRLTMLSGRLW